ncbi:Bifunctional coenzyme A synthase [Taenia solium]|eukprot:TsM_000477200 transcript=TsM_000477200 gene=TsM_000477200
MHHTHDPVHFGLLIVNSDLSTKGIRSILRFASFIVSNKLYILLRSPRCQKRCEHLWKKCISLYYSSASCLCPDLDVCLLLPRTPQTVVNKSRTFDVIITDDMTGDEKEITRLASAFGTGPERCDVIRYKIASADGPSSEGSEITTYPSVCVGGTFDTFHHGHRVLLSIAALLTGCRLLVGVTDTCLLRKKFLAPLIQTCEAREATLSRFLTDIDFPEKQLVIRRLTDPYGPPSRQPDFQCIIASPETVPGCEKINEMRRDLDFDPLHIEKVEYVAYYVDFKFSSSTLRLNLLGRPLLCLQPKHDIRVIGLTGAIASGKSIVANYLKECGDDQVCLVNADSICRRVYESAPESCMNLRNYFNLETIKRLDAPLKVNTFEKSKIVSLAKVEVDRLRFKHPLIVVLEGTLLFEVGLEAICDEIWSVFIPRSEAVNRIEARCAITDEEVLKSVRDQSSEVKVDWWTPCQRGADVGPIGRANIVFCTVWDAEFTREQAKRAWQYLSQAISPLNL